jgi:hypothetical protein
MTIDKRLRKKRKKKGERGHGPLMLNIRIRHIRKKNVADTTKTTVRDALQTLLDTGRMPPGWQFMYVDWKNPKKHGSSWQSGWPDRNTSEDEDEFAQAFAKVVQDQIRMARVTKL